MARRAAKEKKAYPVRADCKEITVAPLPEEENLVPPPFFAGPGAKVAFLEEMGRLNFMRYFDPSKPGTKFILNNITTAERDCVLDTCKKDRDLWKQWVRISGERDTTAAVARLCCEEMEVCCTS